MAGIKLHRLEVEAREHDKLARKFNGEAERMESKAGAAKRRAVAAAEEYKQTTALVEELRGKAAAHVTQAKTMRKFATAQVTGYFKTTEPTTISRTGEPEEHEATDDELNDIIKS
jgi:hypothetical protein